MELIRHPSTTLWHPYKTQTRYIWIILGHPYRFEARFGSSSLFSSTKEGWKPKLLLWETCQKYGTNQKFIHHPLPQSQDWNYIWIILGHPYRFGARFGSSSLFSCLEELETKVIAVRDLFGSWNQSEIHSSPSDTLTRLTLHLNQPWPSLQIWGQIWLF